MIQLFSAYICQEAKDAVANVLDTGWIGQGPKTKQFEEEFAAWCGAKYAVATSSATAALNLAVKVSDLNPGDEVLTTSMTFVSTNHVLLYNRLVPVFVDIDPRTLNMDLRKLERAITPKTKAIMVVHYGGNPVDITKLYKIAEFHGLKVIEDAAHACGAKFGGEYIGSFGLTCFSFHAVKNLPVGDGGMITTNDEEVYQRLLRLRWLGIDKSTFDRSSEHGYKWDYNVAEIGYKYAMNDISAAIGIEQLKYVDRWNFKRTQIAAKYMCGLPFTFLEETPGAVSSYHLCVMRSPEKERLYAACSEVGIELGVHYKPNHLYPMYRKYMRAPLYETERAYKEILSLPLHLRLSFADVKKVIETLNGEIR